MIENNKPLTYISQKDVIIRNIHFVIVPLFYLLFIILKDSFINRSLFFYYMLIIISYSTSAYLFINSVLHKKQIIVRLSTSFIISIAIIIYPLVYSILTNHTEWYYITYFISVFILYISLSVNYLNKTLDYKKTKQIMISIGIIEALICVAQLLKILESSNKFFIVTGSNTNPNVTAMFLALLLPILVDYLSKTTKLVSRVILAGLILTFIFAILILKSRAAYLG